MSILDFFKGRQPMKEAFDASPSEKEEERKSEKETVKYIKYVTGRSIDVVYDFINKDYEQEGLQDAQVISDTAYRDQKISIIKNQLNLLIKQVNIKYSDDLRTIDVQIRSAQEVLAMTTVNALLAEKEIIEAHQKELMVIEQKVKEDDPSVIIMIESYKRGFLKGIAAKAGSILDHSLEMSSVR